MSKMLTYEDYLMELRAKPRTWLITGVAGFIGSNLLEQLLMLGQKVIGMDNFLTGHRANLDDVQRKVSVEQWQRFKFRQDDIRQLDSCIKCCQGVDHVLHQAALGSVPRSIEDPQLTNSCNIDGFLNMLQASRQEKVKSFVYAASSSTYGDEPTLPKVEDKIGKPLSPYALTKYVNELYTDVFNRCYGFSSVGLRYFNVFGQRQDPEGAYAAVIPQWFARVFKNETVYINGDGETSRDFCYIDNVIQANILASLVPNTEAQIYNVAFGQRTTLNELLALIVEEVRKHKDIGEPRTVYREFRAGDVRHSLADISKAATQLSYNPKIDVQQGLTLAGNWYAQHA